MLSLVPLLCISTPAQSQSLWPSGEDWKRSIMCAAMSPITWVPLVGATIIWATGTDRSIVNWASETTPIFGSQNNADSDSTRIRNLLGGAATISTIITPPQMPDESVLVEKAERFGFFLLSTASAAEITHLLKLWVKRERPNGTNNMSFPSGHATEDFSFAAITTRNLDDFHFSKGIQILENGVIYLVASLGAWARVEADQHYPTDVLVGAAIGNFVTSAIYNAFVGMPNVNVTVIPQKDGGAVNIGVGF